MTKADDIFLFVQVVSEGSFSRVAEKQGLTNSVVSKRISRLEKSLNVPLLYRTTRKLSLTDAGKALYSKARVAHEALLEAQNSVSGMGKAVQGKIRITAPSVSARLILSSAIASFCQQYSDVEIDMLVTNHFIDLIDEGYDLAIRTTQLEDSSLVARRLVDSHWLLCASPGYLLENGTPQHPDELSQHQCLTFQNGAFHNDNSDTAIWPFQVNAKSYNLPVKGRFCSNSLESLQCAAMHHAGIAYLPKVVIHDALLSGQLVPVLPECVARNLGIYAVFPRSKQPDKKLSLLVEHFREAFQAKNHWFN